MKDTARNLVAIVIAAAAAAGCASRPPLPSGAIRVRTDDGLTNSAAQGILCGMQSSVPPFIGILEGDPSDPAWPVWLRGEDGRRLYVVWPRGFSVRFAPDATLFDEAGSPILYAGSPFRFESYTPSPGEATKDRPFVAEGEWDTGLAQVGHCYGRY